MENVFTGQRSTGGSMRAKAQINWSPQMKSDFCKFYPSNGAKATGERFGLSKAGVASVARRFGVKVNPEVTYKLRAAANTGTTTSNKAIDAVIRANYLTMPVKRLAAKIKKSDTFLKTRLRQLGLVIPKEIIEQRKIDSRLKKGSIPPNKGKTWNQIGIPKDVQKRMKKTCFKKGHIPINAYDKDGIITIRTDSRTGRKYKYIRVSLGKWKELHLHLWEKKNGKLPKGHCLWFINGDSLDCRLENLELILRKENYRRNSAATNLTDKYVANAIAGVDLRSDSDFKNDLVDSHPELIKMKRTQILLQRNINTHATKDTQKKD